MLDVKHERIKAVVTIVVTAIVNVLNVYGYAVDLDSWINVILSVLSAATIAWSWWKNQNITVEAVSAQEVLDDLKRSRKAKED